MPRRFARRAFLQSGALSALGLATGATAARATGDRLATDDPASNGRRMAPTPFPAEPFITTRGGRFEPAERWVPGALELHPDLLSIPGHGGLAFAEASSIPATTGSFTHLDLSEREDEPLYERLRRQEG